MLASPSPPSLPVIAMPPALSADLRLRAVRAYLNNEGTYDQIATRFTIGRASLNRYLRQFRETGLLEARPVGGSVSVLGEGDMEALHYMILDAPDQTLAQLADALVADGGPRVSVSTLSRALARLDIVRKKRASRRPSGSAKTS